MPESPRGRRAALALQVLVYPVTNLASFDTASYQEFGEGYYLTRAEMEWFRGHYLARTGMRKARMHRRCWRQTCADCRRRW